MITNNKIGGNKTRLLKSKKLVKLLNIPNLYFKLEGDNQTGTHKDRAAEYIINKAKKQKATGVVIGTCGNIGVSVAKCCLLNSLPCYVFVPKKYQSSRTKEMRKYGAKVVFVEGTYEDAVSISIIFAEENNYFDANPVGNCALVAANAYSEIAKEIIDDLGGAPDTVWVPVGDGTTLVGIYKGFFSEGHTPKFVAVSSKGNNAILKSFKEGKVTTLKKVDLRETEINEPLVNWNSFQAEEALDVLTKSNGFVYGANDKELTMASRLLKKREQITSTPASSSVLAGLIAHLNKINKKRIHVLILTS